MFMRFFLYMIYRLKFYDFLWCMLFHVGSSNFSGVSMSSLGEYFLFESTEVRASYMWYVSKSKTLSLGLVGTP